MTAQQFAGTAGRAVADRLVRRARRWLFALLFLLAVFGGVALGTYLAVSPVVEQLTPDVSPVVDAGHTVADWSARARNLIPGGES